MKHILNVGCALLITCMACPASWAGRFDKRIAAEAARVDPQVIEWRRTFHKNPEKPNEEFATARIVAEQLRNLGLEEVVTGVAGTGVVGILKGGKPGPTVALRADMDAVPGVKENNDLPFRSRKEDVAHLCGHDANTAMLMGVATVLSRIKKDLAGNVMFVFQPAEEGGIGADGSPRSEEGAKQMLDEGIFSDRFLAGKYKPSAVFGQHFLPRDAGEVSYVAGSRLFSSDSIRIVVTEEQSTFDKDRGDGIGPYVGLAALIDALSHFPTEPVANLPNPSFLGILSVHSLEDAGDPTHKRSAEISVRMGATTNEAREKGIAWVKDKANSVGRETGTAMNITVLPYAPPIINDPALVKMMRPAMLDAVGKEHLKETPYFFPAADDVALFQQQVPGIYIFLGGNKPGVKTGEAALNHSPEFFVNEDVFITGVKVLSTLAADFLEMHK